MHYAACTGKEPIVRNKVNHQYASSSRSAAQSTPTPLNNCASADFVNYLDKHLRDFFRCFVNHASEADHDRLVGSFHKCPQRLVRHEPVFFKIKEPDHVMMGWPGRRTAQHSIADGVECQLRRSPFLPQRILERHMAEFGPATIHDGSANTLDCFRSQCPELGHMDRNKWDTELLVDHSRDNLERRTDQTVRSGTDV